MAEALKLGVALPAYNSTLDVGHAFMWLGLGAALAGCVDKVRFHWRATYSINGIDLARNTIVYDALNAGCDWVLMVDHDTYHTTGGTNNSADAIADAGVDIIQMIRDADRGLTPDHLGNLQTISMRKNNGVGLIGAAVKSRRIGFEGALMAYGLIDHDIDPRPLLASSIQGRVVEIGRIATAFVAVNLKWLRKYFPTAPWFTMTHDYTNRPFNSLGEDFSFCDEVRKRGGAILCDGRFFPEHVQRRQLVGEADK